MNNKEFITELSERLALPPKETSAMVDLFLTDLVEVLQEGKHVSLHGFGVFEVKKKAERISVNPSTKLRMLVPPKLVLSYKPSHVLKDKFK